eukprot:403333061
MTFRYCVISAVAVCETLSEGKADYCMIVCEQCLSFNCGQILLLPWTQRPGGSKFALKSMAFKLYLSSLICALRASLQLVASHESTSPSATLELCFWMLLLGSYNPFQQNLNQPCIATLWSSDR